MSEKIILKGHKGIGGVTEGEAVVTRNALSYIFDVGGIWDTPMSARVTNRINMPDIYGLDLANKVLVFPTGRGGIFSTAMLFGVTHKGIGPKAIVNVKTHPVFAYASVVLDIPTVDGFEKDPTIIVKTGDWIKVDAPNGIIEVTRRDDGSK